MHRILLLILFFVSNANSIDIWDKHKPVKECSYSIDKKLNNYAAKKLYNKFVNTLLTKDEKQIANLFDKEFYTNLLIFEDDFSIQSIKIPSRFNEYKNIGHKELSSILNNLQTSEQEKDYILLYMLLFSKDEWKCGTYDKLFRSFFYAITNKENCRIEMMKGKTESFFYNMRIIYKKDAFDISFTKDHKIKGIQCTALFYEGY